MTTSSTTTSATGAPIVINGLISGIDTSSVISALMEGYEEPILNIENEQSSLNGEASEYSTINTDLQSLLTAAQNLSTSSAWDLMTGTSSDTEVATANAASGAQSGSATFTVDQLAQGNVIASQSGVSSTGSIVTSAASLLVATGAEALGFSGLSASGGLALGSHTVQVTQSSSAGTVTGGSALPAGTVITTGSDDTLDLSVDGTAYSLTLAPSSGGGDSPAQLVSAINAAASAAGAGVTASLSSSGALQLSSDEQGSAASLSVTGGDALSSLGLTTGQSGSGTDAVVSVDGTSTTLSSITPGEQVSLAAPSGSITATLASSPGPTGSLLSAGSASAQLVSTGDGSLSDIVSNINGSGLAMTATAVEDSAGQYLLQVSANNTGLSGAVSVDSSTFSGGSLGSLQQITAAQDALVSVGTSGGYQLSSSTNTFPNILSGTAITVASTGTTTVSVSADGTGEAGQVSSLVSAANKVLSDIQTYAGYDSATKTAGPLMGSAVLDGIQQDILSMFASDGGTSGYGNSLDLGISLSSIGTLSFDSSTFESAFSADPGKVQSLFTQGGTFSASSPSYSGAVSFVYAGDSTAEGSYDVVVSHSATKASDTGAALSGGAVSAAETLTIAQGSSSASYTTTAGESLGSIASGLNAQFASGGLSLAASVVNNGTQLEIVSDDYGSSAGFQVTSTGAGSGTTGLGGATAGTPASFTGTDVQGTINGVAATGQGQVLLGPVTDPTLDGLSVQVTAGGITSPTDVGSFTYTAGLAAQLQSLADSASNAANGTVTTTINGLTSQASGLDTQITSYEQVAAQQQKLLQNEFDSMETTLGSLKNESSQLTSAISGLA